MSSRKRKSAAEMPMAKRSKESEDNECSRGLVTMEDSHLNAELRMKAMVLISRNRFVAILGPLGSGRTSLALSVAHSLKPIRTPVIVYVNDQLDSTNLFGSYKTSGIPGDFVWEETLFAKTVQKQNAFVVLKGLESATNGLIVSILRLAEDGFHPLPGNQNIHMHKSARLVAIVSQDKNFILPKPIADYPFSITTTEYEPEEVEKLVTSRLHLPADNVRKYYDLFKSIKAIIETLPPTERRVGVRDFFTACRRLCEEEEISPTKAFMSLYESWALHLSRADRQSEIANLIANCFSLGTSDVNFIKNVRVVEIERTSESITIGRAKLNVHASNSPDQIVTTCALTRDYRNLLERIAVCVERNEPVLLNGETGIGKTKIVQQLARYANSELLVINMSLDSDAADLIGGYKPGSIQSIIRQQMAHFFTLLGDSPNHELLKSRLIELYKSDQHAKVLNNIADICLRAMKEERSGSFEAWGTIYACVQRILDFMSNANGGTPFSYSIGIISRAIKDGNWLLIDEINMASVECLNSIASLLNEHDAGTTKTGFRLFACMNPATDAGKRLLPAFIRSKFTEFFVSETREKAQLCEIITHYTPSVQSKDKLAQFYLELREKLPNKFTLRNLCRSLLLSKDDVFGDKQYSMYVALQLGFSSGSEDHIREVQSLMQKYIGNRPALNKKTTKKKGLTLVEGVQFPSGPHKPVENENFLRTDSVRINLQRIACATASGRFPVLLEGETSAGKTSILTYLAELTGHRLHRINNHEHTDIQEYLGSYVADENNQLVFQDGVLLRAIQNGDWVVLDELNLAPTEVLEALNRLLDDNREVYVPEKDQIVKAHPQFRLFATQNPVARYSGRKRLSRALLNRFVVLDIQQPPNNELVEIVCKRCRIQKSAADIMISVMEKLKELRSSMSLFSSTDSFMTLRDLFRWGNRHSNHSDHSDWRQLIADQGYLLLAGRCRKSEDRLKIQKVISAATKREIDAGTIFSLRSPYFPATLRNKFCQGALDRVSEHIVFTLPMRQMIVQCAQAFAASEPVLFVGETGCGKTSVAYLISQNGLESINCHERIDTSDFLGKIRPTNDGLFRWEDGVVIRAMKAGKLLLLDEISLAQDSVLERLNSLLETDRKLLLTDSGAQTELIVAQPGFQFIATMNPGGDHGKKELSKALRNRFTEVWCHFEYNDEDVLAIIQRRIQLSSNESLEDSAVELLARFFTKFFADFNQKHAHLFKSVFAVRDAIVISDMVCNLIISGRLSIFDAIYNTISAVLFDALPMLPCRGFKIDYVKIVKNCQAYLLSLFNEMKFVPERIGENAFEIDCTVSLTDTGTQVGNFFVLNGPVSKRWPKFYCFNAPTASMNIMRVARGLASNKPIMLEGSPGSGKSSLIKAMAEFTGNNLIRINLSEQTEISDLFGTDVPTTLADGKTSFVWQDGPVLKAIKSGAWLLLDEMNLASQSILEAMNSCFDFRNEIYIAELGRRFQIDQHRNCSRFFACQNSAKEGGGRKVLPKSFLNRFTKIYVESMTETDMYAIVQQRLADLNDTNTAGFYIRLHHLSNEFISTSGGNSYPGAPYEYNLRDLLRLIDALKDLSIDVSYDLIYIQRLHREEDKVELRQKLFTTALGRDCLLPFPMIRSIDKETVDFGGSIRLQRYTGLDNNASPLEGAPRLLASQAGILQRLAACVNSDFLSLLIGPAYSGKRTIVELLARLANVPLRIMRMTVETDAQDLMGSYEQIFCGKRLMSYAVELKQLLQEYAKKMNDSVLAAKLNALVLLRNPNDTRVMAFDVLQHVVDDDEVLKRAQSLANLISGETLHFEWIDSDFVRAYMEGEWFLIEDVNVCNFAVLDRLNNCLEKDGELVITEKTDGTFKTVIRHPRFRAFFTMCPDRGTLSPAMRNRTVEISIARNQTFINSVADKMRLVGGPEFETSLALRGGPEVIQALGSFTTSSLLKIRSFALESRQKLFALESSVNTDFVDSITTQNLIRSFSHNVVFPPGGSPITDYLRSFYENSWAFLLKQHDPSLVFFYSRIVSGIQGDKALLFALTDKDITSNLFHACRQVCAITAHSDSTVLGVESIPLEITDTRTDEFNGYLADHLWLFLQFAFQRSRKSHPDSCLSVVNKSFSELRVNEPTVEISAVRLHKWIRDVLFNSRSHVLNLSQRNEKHLFEIAVELLFFNSLLRTEWDESVGDVTLMKAAERLDKLGLGEILPVVELLDSLKSVLKFAVIVSRPPEWRQLCPLPENSIAVFTSIADVSVVEALLTELAKRDDALVALNPEKNAEFIVDVVNQFTLLSLFVKQLDSDAYDFDSPILDFSTKALSAFNYSNENLRRQHVELYLLNARFKYGDSHLAFSSLCQSGVASGPLSLFWRQMNYNQSLHEIPINRLVHFSDRLQALKQYTWQVSNSASKIRELLRSRIETVDARINQFDAECQSMTNESLLLGLERMKSHAPIDAIDPLLHAFANRELTKSAISVLSAHYDILNDYAETVFGNCLEHAVLDRPILPNHNQYILFIRERYAEARRSSEQFEKLGENCRPHNSQYQHLGRLICDFIGRAEQFCVNNFSCDNLPNFIEKLNTHRRKLITGFFQYPDIILPYLFGTCELEFQLNKRFLDEVTQKQLSVCADMNLSPLSIADLLSDRGASSRFASDFRFFLGAESPLPEHIQHRLMLVALTRLKPDQDSCTQLMISVFDWLATRWMLWYNAHSTKRRELYEYRKTARLNRETTEETLEEDEMPDMEMIEIRRLLPDFSKISLEEASTQHYDKKSEPKTLSERDLLDALQAFTDEGDKRVNDFYSKVPDYNESAYLPVMACYSMFGDLAPIDTETESLLAVNHVIALDELSNNLAKKDGGQILDVYKHSDTAEVLNCIEKLSELKSKILLHKEEFPENTILDELLRYIESFVSTPCDYPQMHFAASLEKLLEKAELWERHVPRQYSLESELIGLRETLLEWRKMEVHCWSDILNSVERQLDQNALLASWPLIESFTRKQQNC